MIFFTKKPNLELKKKLFGVGRGVSGWRGPGVSEFFLL